ncbi:restriction endonuclease subunit S [Vibrio owensii]|uniref:restriction endonuclease subunit S n=1 Tax=Vibrio owensii TaxID=696485 RepID=UPI003AAE2E12
MSCNWPRVQISEVCELIVDCVNKTAPRVDYETPFKMIRTPNVKGGKISLNDCRFVEEDTYEKWTRRAKVLRDDVLLTREAPMGEVGIVDFDETVFLGQRIMQYRADRSKLDPHFLLYSFLSSDLQHQFNMHEGSGSVVSHIRVPDCSKFEINLPPLDVQKDIAGVLKKLDRKISVNQQTNQTLEEMAQAIFKSWFVDFDPVKAKMNGEQPEGMDAATASLFPEKLVESELGLIPEGWSVEEAKSQLDVLRGFSYKGKGLVGSLDEGVPMHNLNSVLEGGGYKYAGLKFYSEEFKEKFAIQEGDVLVANTEQGHNHLLIGYGAMVPKHLAHGFFSHHTYRVRPKKNSNMTPEFIERLFGKGRFARQVQGFTNGTTVNMLPTAGMEMPQFVVPPKALAQKFSELVKPMKAMIEENHKSNIELAKLRDTLLPKLLSGEIELAEKAES